MTSFFVFFPPLDSHRKTIVYFSFIIGANGNTN